MKIGYLTGAQGLIAARPTIVFIHGAGSSALAWQGLLSALGRKFNALALDLPGHRQTPGPPRRTAAAYAAWLKSALDQLRAEFEPDPCLLAGHSMGGAIAQSFELAHPGDLAGLVLIGTGAKLPVNPKILKGV
ncbi:MAG: alpha/beta fold hydrolase, partial [Deltaproteobacteria bacterium]|nr:alpha/beta fold hydrolase [Deltaproteobacteria bacterium]